MHGMLEWAPLAFTIVNAAFTIVVWIISKTMVSREEFHALEKRVTHLAQMHEGLPGWGTINDLRLQMNAVQANLQGLASEVRGLHEQTRLMYEHLLGESAR